MRQTSKSLTKPIGRSVLLGAVLTAGSLSLSTPAIAQMSPSLEACRAIADDAARLACFDRALGVTAQTVPTAPTPPPSPEEQFGMKAPKADKGPGVVGRLGRMVGIGKSKDKAEDTVETFGRDVEQERAKEVEAAIMSGEGEVTYQVARVQVFDFIKKRFYMTNGQVWEQTSGTDVFIDEGKAPPGTTARIEKTGFGGYKMSLNGKKRRVKVRRVR